MPHTTWLANMVMVKKLKDNQRMCVGFTNLNKAYPKESYPLPNIDSLVDITSNYTTLSFCDTFFRYNQILMWEKDCLNTTFIMDEGVFCQKMMSFDLKSANATTKG